MVRGVHRCGRRKIPHDAQQHAAREVVQHHRTVAGEHCGRRVGCTRGQRDVGDRGHREHAHRERGDRLDPHVRPREDRQERHIGQRDAEVARLGRSARTEHRDVHRREHGGHPHSHPDHRPRVGPDTPRQDREHRGQDQHDRTGHGRQAGERELWQVPQQPTCPEQSQPGHPGLDLLLLALQHLTQPRLAGQEHQSTGRERADLSEGGTAVLRQAQVDQ